MRGDGSRVAGLTRAVTVSWLAVAVSVGAHLVAHGEHPSGLVTLGITGVVAFFLLPVSLVPFALMRTFLATLSAQVGVHAALSLAAAGQEGGSVPLAQAVEHAGHHAVSPTAAAGSVGMSDHAAAVSVLPGPGMAVTHVLAALVLALLLARAEGSVKVCLALTGRLARALAAVVAFAGLRTVDVGPARSGPVEDRVDGSTRDLWFARCDAPRGPPRRSARPRHAVLSCC